jgi:Tfp pilus assembly protein PilN
MTFVLVMWAVWGVLVVITAALYLYRSRLQRDEEDQIFLDDSFSQEKAEQAEIAASVNKIEPALHIFQWVAAAATLFVIVYYIRDIVNHI